MFISFFLAAFIIVAVQPVASELDCGFDRGACDWRQLKSNCSWGVSSKRGLAFVQNYCSSATLKAKIGWYEKKDLALKYYMNGKGEAKLSVNVGFGFDQWAANPIEVYSCAQPMGITWNTDRIRLPENTKYVTIEAVIGKDAKFIIALDQIKTGDSQSGQEFVKVCTPPPTTTEPLTTTAINPMNRSNQTNVATTTETTRPTYEYLTTMTPPFTTVTTLSSTRINSKRKFNESGRDATSKYFISNSFATNPPVTTQSLTTIEPLTTPRSTRMNKATSLPQSEIHKKPITIEKYTYYKSAESITTTEPTVEGMTTTEYISRGSLLNPTVDTTTTEMATTSETMTENEATTSAEHTTSTEVTTSAEPTTTAETKTFAEPTTAITSTEHTTTTEVTTSVEPTSTTEARTPAESTTATASAESTTTAEATTPAELTITTKATTSAEPTTTTNAKNAPKITTTEKSISSTQTSTQPSTTITTSRLLITSMWNGKFFQPKTISTVAITSTSIPTTSQRTTITTSPLKTIITKSTEYWAKETTTPTSRLTIAPNISRPSIIYIKTTTIPSESIDGCLNCINETDLNILNTTDGRPYDSDATIGHLSTIIVVASFFGILLMYCLLKFFIISLMRWRKNVKVDKNEKDMQERSPPKRPGLYIVDNIALNGRNEAVSGSVYRSRQDSIYNMELPSRN